MKIPIASGKGGIGKTLVATSLALALSKERRVHLLDCDVDAADLHLLLQPQIKGEYEFRSGQTAYIDSY